MFLLGKGWLKSENIIRNNPPGKVILLFICINYQQLVYGGKMFVLGKAGLREIILSGIIPLAKLFSNYLYSALSTGLWRANIVHSPCLFQEKAASRERILSGIIPSQSYSLIHFFQPYFTLLLIITNWLCNFIFLVAAEQKGRPQHPRRSPGTELSSFGLIQANLTGRW